MSRFFLCTQARRCPKQSLGETAPTMAHRPSFRTARSRPPSAKVQSAAADFVLLLWLVGHPLGQRIYSPAPPPSCNPSVIRVLDIIGYNWDAHANLDPHDLLGLRAEGNVCPNLAAALPLELNSEPGLGLEIRARNSVTSRGNFHGWFLFWVNCFNIYNGPSRIYTPA